MCNVPLRLADYALIDALNISSRYFLARTIKQIPVGGISSEPAYLIERDRRDIWRWAAGFSPTGAKLIGANFF